jgi:hypothetical protein
VTNLTVLSGASSLFLATNIRQFAWFEGGGGFGSFGGNQGAGFSAFGASGTGRPAADFLTQMRK